jgi:glycosyltransferase involved in cell wall biosynthesis
VFDLIHAFKGLDGTNAVLAIAGDGELEYAGHLIQSLGLLGRVRLLGWIDSAEMADVMAGATLFILPSYVEMMPVSLLEAMARGLPVVVSRAGGIEEVVRDGVEGILIDAGDVQAITTAIDVALRDDRLRSRMGKASRLRIERAFSDEVVLSQLENLWLSLGAVPVTPY